MEIFRSWSHLRCRRANRTTAWRIDSSPARCLVKISGDISKKVSEGVKLLLKLRLRSLRNEWKLSILWGAARQVQKRILLPLIRTLRDREVTKNMENLD
ncbi:Hypothetical protein NTJ_07812 [Nesidiocoris tenuis]|uniref:Uncharacterized protein n=1 Tax=Nesidiocoris tenuis TaxID=355587 RepID=A0ABN7ASS3_9HEMI|nr:Hypothetical protein NTJ_07812 [Nesidiocoris tenuis]